MTPVDASIVRILVLDDEPFIRNTLKLMLRSFDNIEVQEAGDGSDGLALLDAGFCPDLVLCDIQMTPMDGLAFLRAVQESPDPVRSAIPVVMLTAAVDRETVREAAGHGAAGYLAKPISQAQLTARLNATLRDAGGKTLTRRSPKMQWG